MLNFMDDRGAHGAYYSIGDDMQPMGPFSTAGVYSKTYFSRD